MAKSRAELSALRHLREAYDALADCSSSSSPRHRTRSSHGRVLDTVRSLQQPQPPITNEQLFHRWLHLDRLAVAITADIEALRRETTEQSVSPLYLPVDDEDEQDPKWRVLHEVLGSQALTQYTHDLFSELAAFRSRCGLYGVRLHRFIDHVQLQCLGSHTVHTVVSHVTWREVANAALQLNDQDEAALVSHMPVVLHHCSPPNDDGRTVVVAELLSLLSQLPPPRRRLATRCFTHLADAKRGNGTAPPPDGVRIHRLRSVAKQSHARTQCSRDELDRILAWLGIAESDGVTLASFLSFHVQISDRFAAEDAEFLAFLSRVWGFEYADDDKLGDLVVNFDVRGQQVMAKVRKREVLQKLDHLHAALPSKLGGLRASVGEIEMLTLVTIDHLQGLQPTMMTGLRVLRLTDLGLTAFPQCVVTLPAIEELDLGDNGLTELPINALATMKTLQRLRLDANALTDKSFWPADWSALTSLASVGLTNNRLTTVPSVLAQLSALKTLSLASNRLQHSGVSDEAARGWKATQLETLDLRTNQLTTLADTLLAAIHKSLQTLHVQDNQLSQLPPLLASMERLQELTLSRNHLYSNTLLPPSLLARCSDWQELAMDHNRLSVFPVSAPTQPLPITGLCAIRLAKNRLKTLPPLANLTLVVCEELDVQGNRLVSIDDAFWPAFPRLRVCLLQQNALTTLTDAMTIHCPRLQRLDVFENQLVSVPSNLATLHELRVLNLRDNQLTSIPTEWCEFVMHRQSDRQRVLQSLTLQRNPLTNRILQALIDGSNGGKRVMYKASNTTVIEMYLRKLIDTLKGTVPVQRLARAVHAEGLDRQVDSDADDQDEDGRQRRRWKGRARFVLQYMETQLRNLGTSHNETLVVPTAAFCSLLQRLLVASTAKEVKLVAERFRASRDGFVDARSFLCGVEQVGLFNALAIATDGVGDRRSESVHKPSDAIESIVQYLLVAHQQKTKAEEEQPHEPAQVRPSTVAAKASAQRRPQSARTATRATATSSQQSSKQQTTVVSKQPNDRDWNQRDAELARQRIRIQLLEQQLMDQRLLRMTRPDAGGVDPSLPADGSKVMVYIKLLGTNAGDRVAIPMSIEQSVLDLKSAISSRFQIARSCQILVTKRQMDQRNVRLQGDSTLAAYIPPGAKRLELSLLVGEQVQVEWTTVAQRLTHQSASTDA